MRLPSTRVMMQHNLFVGSMLLLIALVMGVLYLIPAIGVITPLPTVATSATSTAHALTSPSGKQMSIDSYVTQNISTLSPIKSELGGTFYVTSIEASAGKGIVQYEDGHGVFVADFTYIDNGHGSFSVNDFTVR